MNIGIVSPCDVSEFAFYLNEESKERMVFRKSWAPAVNTLILELLRAGHQITIFTLYPIHKTIHLQGKQLNIFIVPEYDRYPGKYLYGCWINAWRIKKCIQQYRSDIELLHAHWTYDYAWAAGQFADKIPVVCTVRDWAPYIWSIVPLKNKITWSFRYVLNYIVFLNKKIKFIANSPYLAERIKKRWKREVPFIPNPIKHHFVVTERKEYPKNIRIVTIAQSNDKRKNIALLLYAFQMFHLKHPESCLWLIGPPFVKDDIQIQKWDERGLLKGVHLAGAVRHDDLIPILDHSTLLVHPSLEESFGNTLIEAMARQVPVLGGIHSGAVPYVLDYGRAGCLCDITSATDIYDKMELIHNNLIYREKLIQHATQLIQERYIDSKVIQQHIDLYHNLISNRKI